MELDKNLAPWLMGAVTVLICIACYHMVHEGHLARAILLGAIGVALNFLIALHVWDTN